MCNRDTQCAADTYCKWDQEKTIGFWCVCLLPLPEPGQLFAQHSVLVVQLLLGVALVNVHLVRACFLVQRVHHWLTPRPRRCLVRTSPFAIEVASDAAYSVADRQCAYDLHCDWSMGSAMGIWCVERLRLSVIRSFILARSTANSSIIGKLLPYGAACVNTRQCDAGLSCIWQQGQSMGSCGYGQATSFSSAPASSVTSVSSTSSVVPPPNSGAARSYAFSAGAGLAMVAAVAAAL
jgi:hypothetical protein